MPGGNVIKDKIGAAVGDFVEHAIRLTETESGSAKQPFGRQDKNILKEEMQKLKNADVIRRSKI